MSKGKSSTEYSHYLKRGLFGAGLLIWSVLFLVTYIQISNNLSAIQGKIKVTDHHLSQLASNHRARVLGANTLSIPIVTNPGSSDNSSSTPSENTKLSLNSHTSTIRPAAGTKTSLPTKHSQPMPNQPGQSASHAPSNPPANPAPSPLLCVGSILCI